MDNVNKFSQLQKFIINLKKTHTVLFNTATSKDFYPNILNTHGSTYNNLVNFKLLGIDLATDKRKGISFENYIKIIASTKLIKTYIFCEDLLSWEFLLRIY